MFDTIHLKPALLCPICGAEQHTLQSKAFGETMAHYEVGAVLRGSPVLHGILQETLWCRSCQDAERTSESPVFLVIWYSVLAGVEQDAAKAEARLAAIDRLDLIGWLDSAQGEAADWHRRFHALYHDVKRWHAHLARRPAEPPTAAEADDPQAERRRGWQRLFDLPEEILHAPDPLAAILARHKPEDRENGDC